VKVLITGASGFIGNPLCDKLRDAGHGVVACSRSRVDRPGIFYAPLPELGPRADLRDVLQGMDAVVHLAGKAHVTSQKADAETEQSYFRINAEGAKVLAHQSAAAGVRHLVFLSSCHAVKAESDKPISCHNEPKPVSAYGRSKLAAEQAIQEELAGSLCTWTILRPPLVYGPGNKANFGLLLKLVKTGIPLPLASVRNRRSFIYVENLVDLITFCLSNAKAFGKVYLPSDGEDLSTAQLIEKIWKAETGTGGEAGDGPKANLSRRQAQAKPEYIGDACAAPCGARLFPFPPSILKAAGRLPGLGVLRKLTSSLYVDSEPIRHDLGWTPPFTMEEGLRRTLASSD